MEKVIISILLHIIIEVRYLLSPKKFSLLVSSDQKGYKMKIADISKILVASPKNSLET